jgi:hypothetical protein
MAALGVPIRGVKSTSDAWGRTLARAKCLHRVLVRVTTFNRTCAGSVQSRLGSPTTDLGRLAGSCPHGDKRWSLSRALWK